MEYIFLSVILLLHLYDDVTGQGYELSPGRFRRGSHKCTSLTISDGTFIKNGSFATVSCNFGHTLEPSYSVIKCTHPSSQIYTWTPTPPSCKTTATSTCSSGICATTLTSTWSQTRTDLLTTTTAIHSSPRPSFESLTTISELQPTATLTSTSLLHITTSTIHTTTSKDIDKTTSGYSTEVPTIVPTTTSAYTSTPDTTAIHNSETATNGYSTKIPTVTPTATPADTSTSTPTQTGLPIKQEGNGSDLNTAYIWAPVVVCVVSIVSVLLFLLWRRRRRRKQSVPSGLKRSKGPSQSITNKAYEENAIDRHCSLTNIRHSRDSGYAEIPLDILHPEDGQGNVYQTIDSLPNENSGNSKTYGHLKQQTTKFIDMNYSHISTSKTAQQSHTDTTYAHTTVSQKANDNLDDSDSTYNRLNATLDANSKTFMTEEQGNDDTETEYNHAKAGSHDPENEDNYSHLHGAWQTSHTLTEKETSSNGRKNNVKKVGVQSLESAKEPRVKAYEWAKEPEIPSYDFAKEPGVQPYEYAKDPDCLTSGRTYGHLNQQKPTFTNTNYSHINTVKKDKQPFIDTTYAHTETTTVSQEKSNNLDDNDSTYNRLNSMLNTTAGKYVNGEKEKEGNDTESEYNHAKTGDPDPETEIDNYSHINCTWETSTPLSKIKTHLNGKENNVRETKASDFAKVPGVQHYEFAKEPEIPQYDFAKSFGNPAGQKITPIYAKVAKKKSEGIDKECANKSNENDTGNSNNYFILEPPAGHSGNETPFSIVENISEDEGTSNYTEPQNHHYFTLEKVDT